jgi:hypothetical protein
MSELFHDDRCYAASPDNIDAPSISPSDLLPGDVLLFRGTHPVSNGIRFWDDCNFDHGALVVGRPSDAIVSRFDASLHDGPWIRDISYAGVRTYPLAVYDDQVTHILVRRHRIPGWREPVLAHAEVVRESTAGYSVHHGINLIIASLTRTATRLRENAERWDSAHGDQDLPMEQLVGSQPRAFAANMHRLFEAAANQVPEEDKQFRICVQYVHDSFDVMSAPQDPADREGGKGSDYYGLVLETRPHDGLLAWAASARTFVEYLEMGAAPGVADEDPFDPQEELRSLATSFGLSVSVLPFRDAETVTDDDLRRILVQSARSTLGLLGWRPGKDTPPFPPAPEAVPAMAAYLLDQLFKQRHLISQFDIASTKSLYDAGLLDVSAVDWRPKTKIAPHGT